MRHLIIDGMLSGTGVRDAAAGGYLDPKVVGLSADLTKRIANWLIEYENAHYHQFVDKAESDRLDQEGTAIARCVQKELPGTQVEYFSNAQMRRLPFDLTKSFPASRQNGRQSSASWMQKRSPRSTRSNLAQTRICTAAITACRPISRDCRDGGRHPCSSPTLKRYRPLPI